MTESDFLMPRNFSKPRMWQWRFWHGQLWKLEPYRWLRGVLVRLYVWLAPVPEPKPVAAEILMMRFRIILWESGPYVEAGLDVPGEKITLLQHPHCNRIIGVKVWG